MIIPWPTWKTQEGDVYSGGSLTQTQDNGTQTHKFSPLENTQYPINFVKNSIEDTRMGLVEDIPHKLTDLILLFVTLRKTFSL